MVTWGVINQFPHLFGGVFPRVLHKRTMTNVQVRSLILAQLRARRKQAEARLMEKTERTPQSTVTGGFLL